VYDILQQSLTPCVWLSWAVIFATYLRFRQAAAVQGRIPAIPVEARNPLQPYLAWCGFVISVVVSI